MSILNNPLNLVILIVAFVCGIMIFVALYKWSNRTDEEKLNSNSFLKKAYKKLQNHETLREEEYDALIEESGYQEKIKFLTRMDQVVEYSNIKKFSPQTPTEVFLILFVAVAFLIGVIVDFVSGAFVYGVWTFAVTLVGTYAILNIVGNRKYKSIESQLKPFIEYAEGFAASSDDIVAIFYQTSKYLTQPLSGYLQDFYRDSMHSGKDKAFKKLENKINHKQMRELLHNLNMCSKFNSDYRQIFREARENVDIYLDGKGERQAVRESNKKDIGLIVAACFMCLIAFNGMISQRNVYVALNETLAGRVMIVMLGSVLVAALYEIARTDKK